MIGARARALAAERALSSEQRLTTELACKIGELEDVVTALEAKLRQEPTALSCRLFAFREGSFAIVPEVTA